MTHFEHALVLEHLKQNNHESALMILYDCTKRMFYESDSTSPIKATMGYNGDIEHITLHFADRDITLSKEQHGNNTQYRATSGNQTLNIDELQGLCHLLQDTSRRSRGESREGKDRTNQERNSTTRERNQLAENNRRALGLYLQRIPEAQRQEVLNSFESYITQEIELSTKISILNKLQEAHRKAGFLPHDFNFSNSQTNTETKPTSKVRRHRRKKEGE